MILLRAGVRIHLRIEHPNKDHTFFLALHQTSGDREVSQL